MPQRPARAERHRIAAKFTDRPEHGKPGQTRQAAPSGPSIEQCTAGLAALGVAIGEGHDTLFDDLPSQRALQTVWRALDGDGQARFMALALRACTLVFDSGDPVAVERLLRLNLWLYRKHPGPTPLQTDAALQAAARRALVQRGLVGHWIATQRFDPATAFDTIGATLLGCMDQLSTPEAARDFLGGVMRWLTRLPRGQVAPEVSDRNAFLGQLVDAVLALLPRFAGLHTAAVGSLVQWAWLAHALLGQLPDHSHAQLTPGVMGKRWVAALGLLHALGDPLETLVELLWADPLIQVGDPAFAAEGIALLFGRCANEVKCQVLHWPPTLVWPMALAPRQATVIAMETPLLAPQRIRLLVCLAVSGSLVPQGLKHLLPRLIAEPSFPALVDALASHPAMDELARDTLDSLSREPQYMALVPRAIPGLLSLLGWVYRVAMMGPPSAQRSALTQLCEVIGALWRLKQISADDLRLLGAFLPLGFSKDEAKENLDLLHHDLHDNQCLSYLLLGWMRRQIDVASSGGGEVIRQTVFGVVWAWTKRLTKEQAHGSGDHPAVFELRSLDAERRWLEKRLRH